MLILLVLVTTSLACNLPGSINNLSPTAIPMTNEEAEQLEENLKATLENPASDGEVTLKITQQQLNAYMVSQINEQHSQFISDPVITLTNNQIELQGKFTQGSFSVDTKMAFRPRIDANGDPKLDVVSIDLGGLPIPDSLTDQVEDLVDDTLADYLDVSSNRFKVSNIAIDEGEMTVTGTPLQP